MKLLQPLLFLALLGICPKGTYATLTDGGMDGGGGSSSIQVWEMRVNQLQDILKSNPEILPKINTKKLFNEVIPSVFVDTRDIITLEINGRKVIRDAKWGHDKYGSYVHFNPSLLEKMPPHRYMAVQLHEYFGVMGVEINEYHTSQKLLKALEKSEKKISNSKNEELYKNDGVTKRNFTTSLDNMVLEIQEQISKLEQEQNWNELILTLNQAILDLSKEIHFYEEVSRIKTVLNTIEQEVKTGTYKYSSSYLKSNEERNLLFLIKNYSKYDVTKMFLKNAEEVEQFESKIKTDAERLKKDVENYADSNIESILIIKGLALKLLNTISNHIEDMPNTYQAAELQNTLHPVMFFNFYGRQKILNCVTTNFIRKEDSYKTTISIFLSSIMNFFPIASFSKKNVQLPYTARSCSIKNKKHTIRECPILS